MWEDKNAMIWIMRINVRLFVFFSVLLCSVSIMILKKFRISSEEEIWRRKRILFELSHCRQSIRIAIEFDSSIYLNSKVLQNFGLSTKIWQLSKIFPCCHCQIQPRKTSTRLQQQFSFETLAKTNIMIVLSTE